MSGSLRHWQYASLICQKRLRSQVSFRAAARNLVVLCASTRVSRDPSFLGMTPLAHAASGGPVGARREPRDALERLGEMMDVGKAAVRGNAALRQIGRAQEFLSKLDTQPQGNH